MYLVPAFDVEAWLVKDAGILQEVPNKVRLGVIGAVDDFVHEKEAERGEADHKSPPGDRHQQDPDSAKEGAVPYPTLHHFGHRFVFVFFGFGFFSVGRHF